MILNLHSLAFNTATASGGGTPAWGTEMGQGEGYRFSFENSDEFLASLLYNSVPKPDSRVYCPLGKGGNQASDYEFVIASLYEKIFVNDKIVPGAKFLLLVIKKLVGQNHIGRRTLKYNPRMTLDDVAYNSDTYAKISKVLDISAQGAWFVSEINVKNQDELHFTAHVLDRDQPVVFDDSADRTKKLQEKILAHAKIARLDNCISSFHRKLLDKPLQLIYYGAPGTGKSFAIDAMTDEANSVRTTFHPDSDYASFVGAYKPTMELVPMSYVSEGKAKFAGKTAEHDGFEKKIVYKYVPQAFLKAYVAAWSDLGKDHFLIIEEINRGNCAQIFGDLFQLLDRNNSGASSYAIHADEDIRKFLAEDENGFKGLSEEQKEAIASFILRKDNHTTVAVGQDLLDGKKLLLPSNLYIWATMNTSDQSLFPIDSAFKRRWNWKYMPIEYAPRDKQTNLPINWTFKAAGKRYSWGDFLRIMNDEIETVTESPDKQMGYFFAKAAPKTGTISEDVFLNKVLFYLWTDVFKDYEIGGEKFHNKNANRPFRFTDFFDDPEALGTLMENLKLVPVEDE